MSSEALIIRDRIRSKMAAVPFFSTFHFSSNKALQIQPESVPFAGVYLIEETGLSEGDANVAEVRFRTTARYGISVIIQNNNAEVAENILDSAELVIETLLYADPKFYNWHGWEKNGEAAVQGFLRKSRSHQFGNIGADNELPIAELRYDLTCDLGTIMYEPDVPDYLHTIHVKTQFPSGGTPAEIAAVQQVESEYIIWQVPPANLEVYRPTLGRPTLAIN